jgi:hypothetical protein
MGIIIREKYIKDGRGNIIREKYNKYLFFSNNAHFSHPLKSPSRVWDRGIRVWDRGIRVWDMHY